MFLLLHTMLWFPTRPTVLCGTLSASCNIYVSLCIHALSMTYLDLLLVSLVASGRLSKRLPNSCRYEFSSSCGIVTWL